MDRHIDMRTVPGKLLAMLGRVASGSREAAPMTPNARRLPDRTAPA